MVQRDGEVSFFPFFFFFFLLLFFFFVFFYQGCKHHVLFFVRDGRKRVVSVSGCVGGTRHNPVDTLALTSARRLTMTYFLLEKGRYQSAAQLDLPRVDVLQRPYVTDMPSSRHDLSP